MLHVVWFVIFTIGAWFFLYKSYKADVNGEFDDNFSYMFVSVFCSLIAPSVGWDLIVGNYWLWLTEFVPKTTDGAHIFTVCVLFVISYIACYFVPPILPLLFMDDDGKIHFKNFRFLNT